MEFLLIAGMLVSAWVFLCVLSGERERRVIEIETKRRIAAIQAARAAAAAAKAAELEARRSRDPSSVPEV